MTHGSQPEPAFDAPFADWLKWALLRNGYDPTQRGVQRRFADASCVPVATVSRLLRNTGQPDVSTCYALGKALGVPVLPLLVRAGHLPPEVLDTEAQPTNRPTEPAELTEDEALTALGITSETDKNAVRAMIDALKAKGREGAV
ncbi:helix-turn-helix transcriptional regulator [Streptomyces spectabilis]|uniref:helix-turn-helix domain-containing protein n=1 Tax=Streptomyces spectabilis TaxID=68270 RepID=UPI0033CB0172